MLPLLNLMLHAWIWMYLGCDVLPCNANGSSQHFKARSVIMREAHEACCQRRQFVEQFFQCSECSQHFGTMAAEEAALAVTTKRDAVLWAWRAHNIVSALALPVMCTGITVIGLRLITSCAPREAGARQCTNTSFWSPCCSNGI